MLTVPQRRNFMAKCSEPDGRGCINWTGCRSRDGYGKVMLAPKQWKAHRVAYVEAKGPIPAGMLVRHRCDNPACVNPEHLELGTDADNAADKARRRRSKCKLKDVDIEKIRRARGQYRDIGARFGVSASMVCMIKQGTRRQYV